MSKQFYGIAFGVFNLFISIVFLFFHKKIIHIQGKSEKGDVPLDQRILTFRLIGIIALIAGLYFILNYS